MNNPFRKPKPSNETDAPGNAGILSVRKPRPERSESPREKNSRIPGGTYDIAALFVRFSIKDQTLFAKRLSFLIKAGIPVAESMHIIRSQAGSASKKKIFEAIAKDVTGGQYLSSSLAKHKKFFGDFAINLIRVGEQGGVLSNNLAYLADELQKKHELRRKVIGALIYPLFISIATLGVTSLLTVYIFPKLLPIFTSLHVELPLTTRMLLWLADYLKAWGILTLLALVLAGIAVFIARAQSIAVRYFFDRLLLSTPVAKQIARRYNLTNFCRTLGLLLRSGVRLSDAIAITADTTNNLAYRRAAERMARSIVKGESMSKAIEREQSLFPDMLSHMVAIGEKTGNLSATLSYLAELYEGEVDELTRSLSSSIEPALMIVLGILVGLIAISVITPIYSITQHLQPTK